MIGPQSGSHPDPRRRGETHPEDGEGREVLPEHHRPGRQRQRGQDLRRAHPELVRPESHRDDRGEDQQYQGHQVEETAHFRPIEGEEGRELEEEETQDPELDRDEDPGDRRVEVRLQLTTVDRADPAHATPPPDAAPVRRR